MSTMRKSDSATPREKPLPAGLTEAEVNDTPEIAELLAQLDEVKQKEVEATQKRSETWTRLRDRREAQDVIDGLERENKDLATSIKVCQAKQAAAAELIQRVGDTSALAASIDNVVSTVANGELQHRWNPSHGEPDADAGPVDDGELDVRIDALLELHAQLCARTNELLKEAEVETEKHDSAAEMMLVTLEDEWEKEIQFLVSLREGLVKVAKEMAFHHRRGTHVKDTPRPTQEADLEREKYRHSNLAVEYQAVDYRIKDIKGEIHKLRVNLNHERKVHAEAKKDKEQEFQEKLEIATALRNELKDLQQEGLAIRVLRSDVINVTAEVKKATEGRL